MGSRLIFFAAASAALLAPAARSQPRQIRCEAQTCTFTLTFDDGASRFEFRTGAPFSGQRNSEMVRTLDNGTHTDIRTPGAMTYRDSGGRTRTEQSAYPPRPAGQPAPPDDFTVVEIRDPVAGFQYILDPVTHVAHRMAFQPGQPHPWQPSIATAQAAPFTQTTPQGDTVTNESLGTKAVSGIAATGYRITRNGPDLRGRAGASSDEHWIDPRTGEPLLTRHTDSNIEVIFTMANYSSAEPDAALFQIPEGYQLVNETGPFQVVHQRKSPGPGLSAGGGQFGLTGACEADSCTLTYNPPPQVFAVTGAPYSGRTVIETAARTLANGTQLPATTSPGIPVYRDSNGSVRTEMLAPVRGAPAENFRMARIDDAANGCEYLLDPVNRVAYRVKVEIRATPFRPAANVPAGGTRTLPDGTIVTEEAPGERSISGVTAVGQRATRTHPPGTYMGNDKAVVQVSEQWRDPNTGVVLISRNLGPEGDRTQSIAGYQPGNPDPSLFLVPADYKVVDEPGKFSFVVPRGK